MIAVIVVCALTVVGTLLVMIFSVNVKCDILKDLVLDLQKNADITFTVTEGLRAKVKALEIEAATLRIKTLPRC